MGKITINGDGVCVCFEIQGQKREQVSLYAWDEP